MNFKKTALLGLTLTCLLLALTGCGAKNDTPAADENAPVSGETAEQSGPFTDMKTVDLDGNEVDSTIFAGKTLTLVNVWNLGCTPCVQELPHLGELNKDLADQGVAVVGLYYTSGLALSDEDRAAIRELRDESGADYPQLLVSEDMMRTAELCDLQTYPTTFFVDSEGNIVDTKLGSHDYDGWKALIDAALADMNADA